MERAAPDTHAQLTWVQRVCRAVSSSGLPSTRARRVIRTKEREVATWHDFRSRGSSDRFRTLTRTRKWAQVDIEEIGLPCFSDDDIRLQDVSATGGNSRGQDGLFQVLQGQPLSCESRAPSTSYRNCLGRVRFPPPPPSTRLAAGAQDFTESLAPLPFTVRCGAVLTESPDARLCVYGTTCKALCPRPARS
jgi:hypothetical protein